MPPGCAKYCLQHIFHQWEKPRDTIATCTNCGGPHPANFRKYKTKSAQQASSVQLAKTTQARSTLQPTAAASPLAEEAIRQEARSYAQVAAEFSSQFSLKDVPYQQMYTIFELLDKVY